MEKQYIKKENDLLDLPPVKLKKSNNSNLNNSKVKELEKKLSQAKEKIESLQKILKARNIDINEINIESDNINEIYENKFFVPVCRENGCNGNLKIFIFEESSLIKSECEKNKNHKNNNILYETFDKFYLKENKIQNCFKCSQNIDSKDKYQCIKCDKLYCSSCFLLDAHIQKNWKNLKIISNKCPKDKNELIYYCVDCGQKICLCCLKKYEENNPHKNHTIKSILNEMPSVNQLNKLKEKIIKKSKAFDILIKSIDDWQNEFNKKIERLKCNLKKEIRIIKKLFINFNHDYMDYVYFTKFKEFYDTLEDYNDINLEKFMSTPSFKEKSYYMYNILTLNSIKPSEENCKLKNICKIGTNGIAENLTKDTFIIYSSISNSIKIFSKVNNNDNNYQKIEEFKIDTQIESFNFSHNRKKIYACLSEKKQIAIFNYNIKEETLELSDEILEIKSEGKAHFNKCVYINDNCLITIDDCNIYLWSKIEQKSKKFTNTKKLTVEKDIYDICQINDNYLLISQLSKLSLLSVTNLSILKVFENIDCYKDLNSLILIDDYVLVNCQKGIAVFSVKTKEIIQYIENWKNFNEKKIVKSFENHIYILNNIGDLFRFNFGESLNLIEKMKIQKYIIGDNDLDDDSDDEPNFTDFNFFINKDDIFFWDGSIYSLIYD